VVIVATLQTRRIRAARGTAVSADDLLTRLQESWRDLARRCVFATPAAAELFGRLVAAYGEPARHYHNLRHVAEVLRVLRSHADQAHEAELLELAAWFHDVIYHPRAADNEERSAAFAADALRRLDMPQGRVERVAELVRMTRDHRADTADIEAQLLLDADLAILGAPPAAYKEYAEAIRREYAWVSDADYRAGRCAVLRRILERPRIYHTQPLFAEREATARGNLAAEIAELS
jgi:predicted metal-dependent HD superfamily phosphohydrolase